ncbi:hypothetical protein D3C72_2369050 [compost metagenome]
MLKLLFVDNTYDQADLNVYDWNTNAIKCYEGVGFQINEGTITETSIGNETWKGLNMQITKSNWLAKTQ